MELNWIDEIDQIITLEKFSNEKWDEKVAIIEGSQTTVGFLKWDENKKDIYSFKSHALLNTKDILEMSKALLK
jgi:hypothetical protein